MRNISCFWDPHLGVRVEFGICSGVSLSLNPGLRTRTPSGVPECEQGLTPSPGCRPFRNFLRDGLDGGCRADDLAGAVPDPLFFRSVAIGNVCHSERSLWQYQSILGRWNGPFQWFPFRVEVTVPSRCR